MSIVLQAHFWPIQDDSSITVAQRGGRADFFVPVFSHAVSNAHRALGDDRLLLAALTHVVATALIHEGAVEWPGGQEWHELMTALKRFYPAIGATDVGRTVAWTLRTLPPGLCELTPATAQLLKMGGADVPQLKENRDGKA